MKKTILLNLLFWSMYAMAQIPFQDHVLHQNPADGLLNPNYATFTDIDGDGDMDVLGCTWYGKKFYWYENTDGQGTYGQQNIILQQYSASVLQPADIDGDGDIDFFAAVDFPNNKIIWFENIDGQGSFGAEQLITTAVDYPRNLHVADIDNDGDLDLFSASFNDDKLAWYENDGSGNFGAQQIISMDLDQVYNVTTADIDGDGDLDVLSSTAKYSDPKVVWYENTDGQGTFGAANLIAAKRSRNVKTGDFDGDGDIDVVFGYLSGGVDNDKLFYYENTDGIGSTWNEHIVDDIGGPYYVRVVDLNNDGNLDVVATDLNDTYWYTSDGNGNFGVRNVILSDHYNWHIETGDMNNDGYPEVISSMQNDAEVRIFNNNSGNLNQSFVINEPSSSAVINKAADMDGDGDMDMVAILTDKDLMYYYQNDGQNNFIEIPINISNISSPKLKLSDLNNDGYTDIILVNNYDTEILTFDGNSSFNLTQSLNQFATVYDVDVSDIIPGGYKEIVLFEYTYLYVYSTTDGINYSVNSFFDTGSSHMYDWDSSIATKDVDNDGLIDIIVSFQSISKTLVWYKNLGNGSFGTEQNILNNSSVKSFKLVDIDNDSDMDILIDYVDNSSGARSISKLTNDGSGNFTQNVLYNITPLSYYANDITYADLDNDGDNDIVYSTPANLAYLENDGGNYLAPQNIYPVHSCYSLQVADVDNDNKNDIIATSVYEGKILWLENTQGSGGIEEGQLHNINVYPNPVTDLLIIDKENINKIEVLDRTGKLIKTYTDTNEINFSNYIKGMYLIRITDGDNHVEVQKVLKN